MADFDIGAKVKPYHRNPRKITKKKQDRLSETLKRLGDLGGIVHNVRTDEIIGGNQRSAIFSGASKVEIVEKFEKPDEQGTIAHGFILWNGKRYAYRQVDWDDKVSAEANLAANIGAGTWDKNVLLEKWSIDDVEDTFSSETIKDWKNDIDAISDFLQTETEEGELPEETEVIHSKEMIRILVSVPIDFAIDAKIILDELQCIPEIEIDYGAN